MSSDPGVYVAGPMGFTAAGRYYYEHVLMPSIASLGVTVLDPWAVGAQIFADAIGRGGNDHVGALALGNQRVGASNEAMIRGCRCVFAVLDGSDVDSGTAAEIGFAAALLRPVVGLRTDLRLSGDNVATKVNLQVEYFVQISGGVVVETLDEALEATRRIVAP